MPKTEPDYRPDINSASREELSQVDSIGDSVDAIMRLREEQGRINGPEELSRLPEINAQQAQQIGRDVQFL